MNRLWWQSGLDVILTTLPLFGSLPIAYTQSKQLHEYTAHQHYTAYVNYPSRPLLVLLSLQVRSLSCIPQLSMAHRSLSLKPILRNLVFGRDLQIDGRLIIHLCHYRHLLFRARAHQRISRRICRMYYRILRLWRSSRICSGL